MNTDNSTHNPNAGWQILGELGLPVSASVEDALYTWQILHTLNLQVELLNKIIMSAQDIAIRANHTETVFKTNHIHITIFIPLRHEVKKQAWGFFHVEKIEDTVDEQVGGDHAN